MTTYERAYQPSSDPRLNLAIIEANLSLFRWERGEARRYLADYDEELDSNRHDPLVLWLNAQAQDDPDDRIERLEMLTTLVDKDNLYARLAKMILENEARYAALPRPKPHPEKRIMGLPRRIFIGVIAVFICGLVALLVLSNQTAANTATVTATTDPNTLVPTATLVPTLLPIHSVPLPSDGYSVQYSAGLLQVTSVEDSSQRVVGTDGTALQPIKGARFYALDLLFECQIGICDTPPEATLSLQVDDKLIVNPRDGALIQASDVLQPIARGRSTDGWMIFEIPSDSVIDGLLIAPKDAAQGAAPLVINLGAATR